MTTDIRVPTTGNAGDDAVIQELKVSLGSTVSAGDVVAVLETAKAALDVESPVDGIVLDVRCAVGDDIAEYAVIMVLGEPGEALPTAASPSEPFVEAIPDSPHLVAPSAAPERSTTTLKVSPRARILAERKGIDVASLHGSGPGGRRIVPDVLSHSTSESTPPVSKPTASPGGNSDGLGDYVLVPVRGARKITAQRMMQSLQESAQVTLTRYASADSLRSFHDRLRAHRDAQGLPRISLSDLVNFAVVHTLPHHGVANSIFDGEGIRQYSSVNLGVAVDTGNALVVPVVRGAHLKSLAELAAATSALVEKARSGSIELADMADGTFTVTNLGMFGVHWFTPVLNTPQSCILGVGAIHQPTPDQPALLPLSFTFDHRALDGANAARALAAIADSIDNIDIISALQAPTNGENA